MNLYSTIPFKKLCLISATCFQKAGVVVQIYNVSQIHYLGKKHHRDFSILVKHCPEISEKFTIASFSISTAFT